MKAAIRERMLKIRNNIPPGEIEKKSDAILFQLYTLPEFQAAKTIMFYLATRSEVKTEKAITHALSLGKRVAIPVVNKADKTMIASELRDYQRELTIGTYGILEPAKDFIRPVSIEEIEVIIIPGLAFDFHGNRLGYGAGYYDRFLAKATPQTKLVALAFECQLVERLPAGPFDLPVHKIITEQRVIII